MMNSLLWVSLFFTGSVPKPRVTEAPEITSAQCAKRAADGANCVGAGEC